MACTVASTQTDACASGIGRLTNPVKLLQIIAQTSANWTASSNPLLDVSVAAIQERACESGIARVTNPNSLLALIATSLCDLHSTE